MHHSWINLEAPWDGENRDLENRGKWKKNPLKFWPWFYSLQSRYNGIYPARDGQMKAQSSPVFS